MKGDSKHAARTVMGTHSMMHSESMSGIWEFLTEEQKKKIALLKLDMKIQMMEMKKERGPGIRVSQNFGDYLSF